MNDAQLEARLCLAKHGPLTDPKYRHDPERFEAQLKAHVKECWQHRSNFPDWLTDYCKKWAIEAAAGSNLDSTAGTGLPGRQGTAAV